MMRPLSGSVCQRQVGGGARARAALPRSGGLGLHGGLIIWLVLLAWSPVLPRTVAVAQPTGLAFDNDAGTTAQSVVITTPEPGAMSSAAGEPTLSPTPFQPGSKGSVMPAGSKLSPRLRLLAAWATAGTMPVDAGEQDRLLSLAGSGAGSLSRDAAGNPVVDVRVLDTSAETIAALAALPADVLSVAPEYATVTLALAPERLNDLASIDAVQYVGEVIRPDGNSSGGMSGGAIVPSAP